MKVLLLTTHLNIGGVGVYTVNLAKYLRKEGIDVKVASSGGDLENILAREGVEHLKINIKTKSEFGPAVWKALPVLARLARQHKFQIIHAQTRVAQALACMCQRMTGVPFVSTCHGFFRHDRLSRRVFPCWGDKVIAISDGVRAHLVTDFGLPAGRIVRIYNGIELENYRGDDPSRKDGILDDLKLDRGAAIVGTVGRFSSVKGFRYLVGAFENVAAKYPQARLVIVGKGPEEQALNRKIRQLGLEDKAHIVSNSMPDEKYLYLFDVFCLPSIQEGLGLSLMEAMAAGRACVASDVGGISELIADEKEGILVPPGDERALSAAIMRLVGDDDLRRELAQNARKKAMEKFSIKDTVKSTMEVYREVVGA